MAIKATKPAINVIEKLNELKQHTGVKGQAVMRADTMVEARTAISAGRKNMYINGAMNIWQRGTSFTGVGAGETKVADRWRLYVNTTSAVATVSRSTDTPPGFDYSLKVECTTADAAVGGGDRVNIDYRMETTDLTPIKTGTNEAVPFTISFWVKSNIIGTYCLDPYFNNSSPTCSKKYNIDVANVWEHKSMTFPPANIATGANPSYWFWLMAGSNYTADTGDQWTSATNGRAHGQTANVFSNTGNTFYITGMQMEVGTEATEFDHQQYGEELHICKRYFEYVCEAGDSIGNSEVWSGGSYVPYMWSVEKRVSPTMSHSGSVYIFDGGGAHIHTTTSQGANSKTHGEVFVAGTARNGFVRSTSAVISGDADV